MNNEINYSILKTVFKKSYEKYALHSHQYLLMIVMPQQFPDFLIQ